MEKKKRKKKSKINVVTVLTTVLLIILCVMFIHGTHLQNTAEAYAKREAELDAKIAQEEERTLEIEEYKKYMQTDQYIEDIAREKLGLVYPNETIYKAE